MYEKEIIDATKEGNLEAVKWYLSNGANVDTREEENTLLIIAAAQGDLEIARYLIEKGADINASGASFTPLSTAWEYYQTKMVELLVIQLATQARYIEANEDEPIDIVTNKLITTLLYESKRHGWHSTTCVELRDYIGKLNPSLWNNEAQ